MEKIIFSTSIKAPKEKVWSTLWDDATYRKWTSVFSESSHAETDWKEGSKVLFIDNKGDGMVSKIEQLIPNELMSFQQLGEVKNRLEDTESDAVKAWAGGYENYFLKETDGVTELTVEMDISEEYKDFFTKAFLQSLEMVKSLSEAD